MLTDQGQDEVKIEPTELAKSISCPLQDATLHHSDHWQWNNENSASAYYCGSHHTSLVKQEPRLCHTPYPNPGIYPCYHFGQSKYAERPCNLPLTPSYNLKELPGYDSTYSCHTPVSNSNNVHYWLPTPGILTPPETPTTYVPNQMYSNQFLPPPSSVSSSPLNFFLAI